MTAIPLKELINLSDEEITKRNSEEARHYIKLRDIIKSENESTVKSTPSSDTNTIIAKPQPKPKRKCSEKQLAALAAGRAKNPRLKKKFNQETEAKN